MKSIKTPKDNVIIVPVDFSAASDNALNHAVSIANLFDNEITLLHVISETLMGNLFLTGLNKKMIYEGVQNKLNALVKKFNETHPNVKVNQLIKEGKVYKNIIKTSKELACDSIVMGFNGLSGVEQFMGSTTSRVVKNAPVPIVIVKENNTSNQYKKIVLPIDLEMESKQKVSWAVHLAKKYDSEVHVIMEIEQDTFLKQKVNAAMNQVSGILKKNNVNHICKILNDEDYPEAFGHDIVQYCDEVDADLVLILTQKEVKLKDLFLGSFAERIIKKVQIPVMAINPKETGVKIIVGY